jgi:antitoxin CptB
MFPSCQNSAGTLAETMMDAQLRWRLRRGMKELDVLFERYFTRRYPAATASERKAFADLLEREDPEILQWIMSQAAVPLEFSDVIRKLQRHD